MRKLEGPDKTIGVAETDAWAKTFVVYYMQYLNILDIEYVIA